MRIGTDLVTNMLPLYGRGEPVPTSCDGETHKRFARYQANRLCGGILHGGFQCISVLYSISTIGSRREENEDRLLLRLSTWSIPRYPSKVECSVFSSSCCSFRHGQFFAIRHPV